MARNVLKIASIILGLSVCSGCAQPSPSLNVIRGNLAYNRGDFQRALVHYLSTTPREGERGWLMFNIGNVYYAMGEQEAALNAWEEARMTILEDGTGEFHGRQTTLIHAASYNRGVLFYQRGQYSAALSEFRYSLDVDNRSMAAKQNLELTLLRLESAEQAEEIERQAERQEDESADPSTLRILDYVRRKEAQRWVANRERDREPDPRDW